MREKLSGSLLFGWMVQLMVSRMGTRQDDEKGQQLDTTLVANSVADLASLMDDCLANLSASKVFGSAACWAATLAALKETVKV